MTRRIASYASRCRACGESYSVGRQIFRAAVGKGWFCAEQCAAKGATAHTAMYASRCLACGQTYGVGSEICHRSSRARTPLASDTKGEGHRAMKLGAQSCENVRCVRHRESWFI